jgi:hypothetical protein
MKSVLKFALALTIFAGALATQAQTSAEAMASCTLKAGEKITRKCQLHDGCHSRYAQMLGKPCH